MNKATPRNEWKHYHHSLNDALAKDCKTMIEWVLGISQSAFYRKLNSPQQLLSIADKLAHVSQAVRGRHRLGVPNQSPVPVSGTGGGAAARTCPHGHGPALDAAGYAY